MKKSRFWRILVGCMLLLALACTALAQTRSVHAWLLGQRGFEADQTDSRVLFEPVVSEERVKRIREQLDSCISRVERLHGRPFLKPVRVHLCADQASYNERTAARPNGIARGAVFAERLFLSPRAFTSKTETQILTHELSHLHFLQILGTAYTAGIPGWFQEGMAVHVSGGGGAEPVTVEMARIAIQQGKCMQPEDEGATFPKMAAGHGLQHHMFYRQSELFVSYLETKDPEAFGRFLSDLFDAVDFKIAFERSFRGSIAEFWQQFLQDNHRLLS